MGPRQALVIAWKSADRKRVDAMRILRAFFWQAAVDQIREDLDRLSSALGATSCDTPIDLCERVERRVQALLYDTWETGSLLRDFHGRTEDALLKHLQVVVSREVSAAWKLDAAASDQTDINVALVDNSPVLYPDPDVVAFLESWRAEDRRASDARELLISSCFSTIKDARCNGFDNCPCMTHSFIRSVMWKLYGSADYLQEVADQALHRVHRKWATDELLASYDDSLIPFDDYYALVVRSRVWDALRHVNRASHTDPLINAIKDYACNTLELDTAREHASGDDATALITDTLPPPELIKRYKLVLLKLLIGDYALTDAETELLVDQFILKRTDADFPERFQTECQRLRARLAHEASIAQAADSEAERDALDNISIALHALEHARGVDGTFSPEVPTEGEWPVQATSRDREIAEAERVYADALSKYQDVGGMTYDALARILLGTANQFEAQRKRLDRELGEYVLAKLEWAMHDGSAGKVGHVVPHIWRAVTDSYTNKEYRKKSKIPHPLSEPFDAWPPLGCEPPTTEAPTRWIKLLKEYEVYLLECVCDPDLVQRYMERLQRYVRRFCDLERASAELALAEWEHEMTEAQEGKVEWVFDDVWNTIRSCNRAKVGVAADVRHPTVAQSGWVSPSVSPLPRPHRESKAEHWNKFFESCTEQLRESLPEDSRVTTYVGHLKVYVSRYCRGRESGTRDRKVRS